MKRIGVVLCGGRSSRMGRPKAWLPWFGMSMVEHVVSQISSAVDQVIVVTSPDLDLPAALERRADVQIVRDREPDRGPLAGLREGFGAQKFEFAFVTSTDAPFVTSDYVEKLFDLAEAKGRAVAPMADGHVQVLSAVYPGEASKMAEDLLAAGVARPLSLLEKLEYQVFEESPARDRAPWQGFNTPARYLECVRAEAPQATAEIEILGSLAATADQKVYALPVGLLSELLVALPFAQSENGLVVGDRLGQNYYVSLGGRERVRDLGLPIGPGERISLIDAPAGD